MLIDFQMLHEHTWITSAGFLVDAFLGARQMASDDDGTGDIHRHEGRFLCIIISIISGASRYAAPPKPAELLPHASHIAFSSFHFGSRQSISGLHFGKSIS